jgi:hypothetical protein
MKQKKGGIPFLPFYMHILWKLYQNLAKGVAPDLGGLIHNW